MFLIQVAREEEPRNLDLHTFQHLPGRPIDEILLTFKWLLAQEGVNYPIDRGKAGRLYTLNRIHEMRDGMRDGKHIDIDEIIQRCQTKGQELPPISGVDFQRITRYILS